MFGRQQDSELLCAAMTWVVEGVRGADQTTTDLAVFLWVENVEAVTAAGGTYGRRRGQHPVERVDGVGDGTGADLQTFCQRFGGGCQRCLQLPEDPHFSVHEITSLCSTSLVGMKLTPHLRPGLAALCVLLSDFWKGGGAMSRSIRLRYTLAYRSSGRGGPTTLIPVLILPVRRCSMPVVIDFFEVGWSSRRTIEAVRLSIVIRPRIVHYECPIRVVRLGYSARATSLIIAFISRLFFVEFGSISMCNRLHRVGAYIWCWAHATGWQDSYMIPV